MQKAIKTLEKRIELLRKEQQKLFNIQDEPELMSDYHFAQEGLVNISLEIDELRDAIKVLNKTQTVRDHLKKWMSSKEHTKEEIDNYKNKINGKADKNTNSK